MSMNTEGMQVNLIDSSDLDFNDHSNSTEVRYSVLQNPQSHRKRPFCQEPFKMATVCLSAFCLLLLMVLVVTNVHSESSSVQNLFSSAEAHMLKTCVNVTDLTDEILTLRKEKSDLEKERSQLMATITKLEASASIPVRMTTQSTPVRMTTQSTPVRMTTQSTPVRMSTQSTPVRMSTQSTPVRMTTQSTPVRMTTQSTPVRMTTQSTPVRMTTQSTPVRVPAKRPCAADWHYFSGSCYFISVYSDDWADSQAYCKRYGGHLAIILTPEEQTFIWDLLPRGHWNAYWFGLSDEKVEDDWYWVDGTKLVRDFWEDGEPNDHMNEDCAYMVKTDVLSRVAIKSWYDAPCYMHRPFICEKVASS